MITEIVKNIPLPNISERRRKYSFDRMDVGDSFWTNEVYSRVMSAGIMWATRKCNGAKFKVVNDVFEGKLGLRVFRIK